VRSLTLLAGALLALGSSACEDQGICAPSSAGWGFMPGQGDLLDSQDWESTPLTGTWIPYPHMVGLTLFYGGFFPECLASDPQSWISASPSPATTPGGQFVEGGSNSNEWLPTNMPGIITIFNNSCADYYIRIVIHCPPNPIMDAGMVPSEAGDAIAPNEAGDAITAHEGGEGGSPRDAEDK
jgi:hypothetical protein